MKSFFHADTDLYRKRLKSMMITVLVPLAAACVFCTVSIVLRLCAPSYDGSFPYFMMYLIIGCVFMGMVSAFAGCYITEKYIRRHSRYTYFDILPCGMVYSVYAGEHTIYEKRVIYRRLYYIPFAGVEEITRDPARAPHSMLIKGEVRCFLLPSDRLGYHIDEEGSISFDSWELNDRGFTELKSLEINDRIGNTKQAVRSALYYLEQFRSAPEKKPFNISDYVTAKKNKPRPKTSNPLLEAPQFDRKW